MNKKIGIFDSGIGGLTVLDGLLKVLPLENYVFIADEKNFPYGNKSKEDLLNYSDRIIKYFISIDVKLIIIACNTISSMCLSDLRKLNPNVVIFGVIDATIDKILEYNNKKILLFATENTINSNIYKNTIESKSNNIIYGVKTNELAEMIENNDSNINDLLTNYVNKCNNFDIIVLGCTHYKLIINNLKDITNCDIINSSDAIVNYVDNYLVDNNLLSCSGSVLIYTTGNENTFNAKSKRICSFDAKHIDL